MLSAHEDMFDSILVRWNKYEEWSPWNCILLTKEEASAHAKLENVTEVRLLFFVCLYCFKPIADRWVWGTEGAASEREGNQDNPVSGTRQAPKH